jgi:acyl-CoA thioesterase-1
MTSADVRVCSLGDSSVAGVGDPEHRGWTGRLAAGSAARGRQLTSYVLGVLGVRGETSRQVLGRWRAECTPRLPAGVDGRVAVSFGVNDTALADGVPQVAAADSLASLAALLEQASCSSWATFVVGPPPVDDPAQNRRTAELDEGSRGSARPRGSATSASCPPCCTARSGRRRSRPATAPTPGAAGYAELAELVRPHWQGWLDGPGR